MGLEAAIFFRKRWSSIKLLFYINNIKKLIILLKICIFIYAFVNKNGNGNVLFIKKKVL